MFDEHKIVIKSGAGDNYFEATANLDPTMLPATMKIVMDGLRAMQRERMEWAAGKARVANL
jgi:hypothetical protein